MRVGRVYRSKGILLKIFDEVGMKNLLVPFFIPFLLYFLLRLVSKMKCVQMRVDGKISHYYLPNENIFQAIRKVVRSLSMFSASPLRVIISEIV